MKATAALARRWWHCIARLQHRGVPYILLLAFFAGAASSLPREAAGQGTDAPAPVAVHLFWSEGCPHCARAKRFLEATAGGEPRMALRQHDVAGGGASEALFWEVTAAFAVEVPAVPLVVVGNRAFVGYLDDQSTGSAIRDAVAACHAAGCPDVTEVLQRRLRDKGAPAGASHAPAGGRATAMPERIRLPLIGEIATAAVSLPVLTVLLAAVDGFNPCAMWVLVFLIGILLGMTDHVRMWLLGGAFLVASAVVYFLFMAAWLNLLLLLGALAWIRIAVGIVALVAGGYYVSEYVRNPAALCKVTAPEQRQRVMDGIRQAVRQRSFLLALGGIVVVAAAVNLVELLCSAGIPAIYTQVLALSALPAWQYHLYLLLYIIVFLLDDLVVFATAMVTLQASGLASKYARYSHLIGGVVLAGLGGLLLFRPGWLAFAV